MNPGDPESAGWAAGDDDTPQAPAVAGQEDLASTQVRPRATLAPEAAPESEQPPDSKPVLGVVIVFSETHESDTGALDSRLGRVYPLREGDILLVGRHPAPAEVLRRDGQSVPPTHRHLFPTGELYGYISRQHLTIEMDALGGTILTDYSRYGIYLEKAGKWFRRKDPSGPPEPHRVTGEDVVTLMDDLGEPSDRNLADRRSRYQLQLLRPGRGARADALTETRP